MNTDRIAGEFVSWVCPRCHFALRYPMALCSACGRFGNSSARWGDGSIELAEIDRYGVPSRRAK